MITESLSSDFHKGQKDQGERLVCLLRGAHTKCPNKKYSYCLNRTPFLNHCKYCFVAMINHPKDDWIDEEGNYVKNLFVG